VDSGLAGKRALITGGTTGIGLAIAKALAREGVDVGVASRSARPAAIEELRELGVRVEWIQADVSAVEGVTRMVTEALEALGGLDLFVNNAAGTWHEPITRLTEDAWSRTLATNLTACAFACREVGRIFIAQGNGSILIVGSTAAHTPLYRESSYRVSKAGLKSLMEVVSIELAPYSVRVNLITPGAFLTELTRDLPARQMGGTAVPLRRPGRVEELGATAVLLLSDALSSYTTGAEVVVDGGLHLRPLDLYSDDELRALNEDPLTPS
jgi:NAD(P)-dependent dehydrogenase (short-subunit alcohol dehydrogenase family)